jgi:hypothetical protein
MKFTHLNNPNKQFSLTKQGGIFCGINVKALRLVQNRQGFKKNLK